MKQTKTEHDFEVYRINRDDGLYLGFGSRCKNCDYEMVHRCGTGSIIYTSKHFGTDEYLKCPNKKA